MSICQDCGEPGTHWSCAVHYGDKVNVASEAINEPVYDIWEDTTDLYNVPVPLPELTPMEMVREFHTKFDCEKDPYIQFERIKELRFDLLDEELVELWEALEANDRVAIADALGDILYVTYGAADTWGIDIDRVLREIHRSNMTKEGGGTRADGKILKGPNYSPPDLSFVLEETK